MKKSVNMNTIQDDIIKSLENVSLNTILPSTSITSNPQGTATTVNSTRTTTSTIPASSSSSTPEVAATKTIDSEVQQEDEKILGPLDILCFEDYGKITSVDQTFATIDSVYKIPLENIEFKFDIGDVVKYFAVKDSDTKKFIARKVLTKESKAGTTSKNKRIEYSGSKKIVIGKVVDYINGAIVIHPQKLRINLKSISPDIFPASGDWLSLNVFVKALKYPATEEKIIFVESLEYLRRLNDIGVITSFSSFFKEGIIKAAKSDTTIYFNLKNCKVSFVPSVNKQIKYLAVESDHKDHTWRAEILHELIQHDEEEKIEKNNDIKITQNYNFGKMILGDCENFSVNITNESDVSKIIKKCYFLSKRSENQIKLLTRPLTQYEMKSGETVTFLFQCAAKYIGRSKELFIISFEDFEICQYLILNICDTEERSTVEDTTTNKYVRPKGIIYSHESGQQNTVKAPPIRMTPHVVDVRLSQFYVPTSFWKLCRNNAAALEKNYPYINQPLNDKNYCKKFHLLEYIAEIYDVVALQRYNKKEVIMKNEDGAFVLEMENLAECQPLRVCRPSLVLENDVYKGSIFKINRDAIYLKLFDSEFLTGYRREDVTVKFSQSRQNYVILHNAVEKAFSKMGADILLSRRLILKQDFKPKTDFDWFNPLLNEVQKLAVSNFFNNKYNMPFIIIGPPGTGKTITLIETILQVLTTCSDSRIIIATSSNNSANHITELLLKQSWLKPGMLVRLVSLSIASSGRIPPHLQPYCDLPDIASKRTSKRQKSEMKYNGIHMYKKLLIGRHRITISTFGTMGKLMRINFPKGHFTHVFVDEAGQAVEPEILIPFSLLDDNFGQIAIAGDPKQLGPVILSPIGKRYGLELSFLERILSTNIYKDTNNSLFTQLVYNYRSLPKVLELPNRLFYENTLIPKMDPMKKYNTEINVKLQGLLRMMSNENIKYDVLNFPGIFFHGIRGQNYREGNSPSWYNPSEATMAFLFTCKLYKNGFDCDDIGIITPYIKQVKHIRDLFNDSTICSPKIGTIEEFQGQEKKIIILSTVRSMEVLVSVDIERQLGFINNPKRINVALTRGKLLTMIFGNPHLLSLDPLWLSIIKYVKDNGGYLGCNLPCS